MRTALAGLAVAMSLLVACDEELPGDPAVYERIAAMTDCAELQETFDRNYDDAERREPGTTLRQIVMSYGDAADRRMREIGCY